jgi:hypothetical protein
LPVVLPLAAAFPAVLFLPGCLQGAGSDPAAVRAVVEQAAAARDAGEFDAFASLFTGEKAGRYRESLKVDHGGDSRAFFAGKRRMVVTGPVSIRRQAFATVRVFLVHSTGYKPFHQAAVVFHDNRWQIDSFIPGDLEEPRTEEADSEGVIGLLEAEVASPRPPGGDGTFRRIQIVRALEVVVARRLAVAVPPLTVLLREDDDGAVRAFAAHILGRLADREAIPALVEALEDGDLRVRGDAATALGTLAAGSARVRLEEMAAADPSDWVKERAAEALEALRTAPPDST